MNALANEPPKAVKPSPSREMGGQHCSPPTADRRTKREQAKVDHAREVAECKAEGGAPF